MFNRFARFILASTALSPILGAVTVIQITKGEPIISWCWWFIVAALLIVQCSNLLRIPADEGGRTTLKIVEFENNDKEILAFLLTYMLPFISTENFSFGEKWPISLYVFAIILLVVWHTNAAFHFNPVMGLLGYHFDNIKTESGRPILLIGRKQLRGIDEINAVEIAENIYIRLP